MSELIEAQIKEFLSRIDDESGTVRRYAKSLKHQVLWQVKEKSNEGLEKWNELSQWGR